MVYFATLPKQCCCTCETDKHKNCICSLNVIRLFYEKLLKKHIAHRLSSFIPLSKQPIYSRCSKCPLFARTHACRRFLQSLTAALTTLLQTALNVNLSLLEFVDIVDLHLVHMLLHDSPNLVINGVQVRAVGGHSSGEMKLGVSGCRNSILPRAQCAGALSCRKTKLSPATCLIASNIYCDRKTSQYYVPLTFTRGSTKQPSNAHFRHCDHNPMKLSKICNFCVCLFCKVVQKHCLGKVEK